MPHIELSLSPLDPAHPGQPPRPLRTWAEPVAETEESALLIDAHGMIVALSRSLLQLCWAEQTGGVVGRSLTDPGILQLVDFTAAGNELSEHERGQIPPLLALRSGRLARGLMRWQAAGDDMRQRRPTAGGTRTLDVIATPLRLGDKIVGSLSFLTEV